MVDQESPRSAMKCSNCNSEIADKALICYRCGNATTAPRIKPPAEQSLFVRPRRSRWPMFVIVIVIVAALILAWLFSGGVASSASARPLLHPFRNALQGVADLSVLRLLDGQIAERHDADEAVVFDDRQPSDLVLGHQVRRLACRRVG